MPKISELVDQAFSSDPMPEVTANTARLKSQYGGSGESFAEATRADASGLAALDPTNPSNLPGLLEHGLPMAIQMYLTGKAGPEAGILAKLGIAGASSLLGGDVGQGIHAARTGELPGAGDVLQRNFLDFILGAGGEGFAQGGGAAMRRVSGKSTMLSEGAAAADEAANALSAKRSGAELDQTAKLADVSRTAEVDALKGQESYDVARAGAMQDQMAARAEAARKAEEGALKARSAAESEVQKQKALVDQQVLKHSEKALVGVRDEEVERLVREGLGQSSPLSSPTIESLTERVSPVRESAQRNVRGVFSGISGKFESTLQPYYELPVHGNFATAVDAERGLLAADKKEAGKALQGLMNEMSSLDAATSVQAENLPPVVRREYERLQRSGQLTPEQLDAHIKKVALGYQGSDKPTADLFAPPDVRRVDKLRKDLTKVVIGDGSPVDKRVANRLIQNIDQNLATVLPENIRADWTNLRREWHEANNVFSPQFRSMLYKADTPEKVADVLYGSAKGKQADRVLTVIGKTPKDEMPMLRSAFVDKLTRGDVVKNVQNVDKRVFKAFFNGSGFDDPKAWIDTLGKKIDFDSVVSDPELYARFNTRVQQGLKSYGSQRYRAALAKAEQQLKSVPDSGKVIQDALSGELTPDQAADMALRGKSRPDVSAAQREALSAELTPSQAGDVAVRGMTQASDARMAGEMEGMKTPLLGKRMQGYLEHRTSFHTAMALATLGTIGGEIIHHPIAASLPLVYLGSSKVANMMLSNPKIGRMWYNALNSKNMEQTGFWLGRLFAASLTEGSRQASEE